MVEGGGDVGTETEKTEIGIEIEIGTEIGSVSGSGRSGSDHATRKSEIKGIESTGTDGSEIGN